MSSPFDGNNYDSAPFQGSRIPPRIRAVLLGLNITLIGAVLLTPIPFYVLLLYVLGIVAYDEVPRIRHHGLQRYLRHFNIKPLSKRDSFVIVGTLIVMYASLIAVSIAMSMVGAPAPSQHAIQGDGLQNPVIVLLYIVMFFIFVAPFEEYIFRHKLQKDWLGRFNVIGRLLAASVIFGVLHYPVYGLSLGGTLSVGVIALNALFFGTSYEITDNLAVPTVIHAVFNSISVLLAFAAASGLL